MRAKVTVAGSADLAAAIRARLGERVNVATDAAELTGSDVVVFGADADVRAVAAAARDRAPNAVLVLAGDGVETACRTTLFPRARVIGAGEAGVAELVEAAVFDTRAEFRCIARCEGERGIDGRFELVPVRIGRAGIEAIL